MSSKKETAKTVSSDQTREPSRPPPGAARKEDLGNDTKRAIEEDLGNDTKRAIKIEDAVYPLRAPITGLFEVTYRIDKFGPLFIGMGSTDEEAYQDWCNQVHSTFQTLYRKRPFEMSRDAAAKWDVLCKLIDVDDYRSRMPVVTNQTGWISEASTRWHEVTWWPSEHRERIDFERMPGEFADFKKNQWFEAIVERDRQTWELQKGRHVQPIEPIPPMDDDEAARQLAGAKPISELPEAPDGKTEP